ncbi:ferritin-like protein [Streptomyces sp. NPDC006487]|uniref:ferritin-like domain-containing protein n=1 Tax=Streptomyces sp. NPDC006487 TaxID=3364748 RepID=UPI0036975FBF
MTTLADYRSNRIVELMDEPSEHHDAEWLKEALQQAIMLELATLPPYLCGLWSIKNPDPDEPVSRAIREIVFDEMSHLGLACNLLTTIGGVPRLADAAIVPKYPGPLPGGVRPELTVSLSGLTKQSLDMYSRIEEPDHPVTLSAARTHTSIGAFYTAILDAFRKHKGLITGARQLVMDMKDHGAGNSIYALNSFADVKSAIEVIKEQGEGTSASPENPHPGELGELAHFYVFRELFHERKLKRNPDYPDRWEFTGDVIPMPQVLPMGTVPPGGWAAGSASEPDPDTKARLATFNRNYSELLRLLERAWKSAVAAEAAELLMDAVGQMFTLKGPAWKLMAKPLPDGSGKRYGPEFLYTTAP